MATDIAVVVPWRGGCRHREAALAWVRARYADLGLKVTPGVHDDGPWIKALAVDAGLAWTDADIVVIADADVWTDGLFAAIRAVVAGAHWAVPHTTLYRLDAAATADVLAGSPLSPSLDLDERPYRAHAGGGIVVLRRSTYRAVPLDPRFLGWGQEDDSWAVALKTIAGRAWRGSAALFHLWHPPQPRASRTTGSEAGLALHRRYLAARTSPAAMRRLVDEAKEARWACASS